MAKAKSVPGLRATAPTGENARLIARTRLEELYEWSTAVDQPYAVHELHNLRIAAKRLRYTLELFAEVLPPACELLVKEVEQIQEELGLLHDSDVMIALLRLCLASQESPLPEEAIAQANAGGTFVEPELVAALLDSSVSPSVEQRYGLEQLLRGQQQEREERYQTFRQHWYRLQERDFRRQLLSALDDR